MPDDSFACPECGRAVRRLPHLRDGAVVRCPRCDAEFPLPAAAPEEDLPPPPRRDDIRHADAPRRQRSPDEDRDHATRRGDDPPRRRDPDLRRYDRDEDEDYPRSLRRRGHISDLSADYRVDLPKWLGVARRNYLAYFGPAIGFLMVQQAISLAIAGTIGQIGNILIDPPLQAGQTIVALAQIRGERWVFSNFFGGFKLYGQTVGLALLLGICVFVALLPGGITGTIVGIVLANNVPPAAPPRTELGLAVGFGIGAVFGLLPAAYLGIRLGFYSLPLVLDRNFTITDAMWGSWKLTRGHMAALTGVSLVLWLIQYGPMLASCGVLLPALIFGAGVQPGGSNEGVFFLMLFGLIAAGLLPMLFTVPFVRLVTTAAYLDVVGEEEPLPFEWGGQRRRDEDPY